MVLFGAAFVFGRFETASNANLLLEKSIQASITEEDKRIASQAAEIDLMKQRLSFAERGIDLVATTQKENMTEIRNALKELTTGVNELQRAFAARK